MSSKIKGLEKVHELKKELDSLRPISAEDEQRIMQKFRLEWNFNSNHLEGNSLDYGETKALLLHGITAQGKPLKDHFEITGHNEALLMVEDVVRDDRPLTENFIRQLHELILKEPYTRKAITPDGKETTKTIQVGQYKSSNNHVKTATGEIFYFASAEETPALMTELVDWLASQSESDELEPVILAAEFHYKFIRIHPFDDGNGRMARILMNFILLKFGYPPVIIEAHKKEEYFAVLRQADGGNLNPFVEYIFERLVKSLELMISGAKGEKIEDVDDIQKQFSLLDAELSILNEHSDKNKEDRWRYLRMLKLPYAYREFKDSFKLLEKHFKETAFGIKLDGNLINQKNYISNSKRFFATLDNGVKELNFTYHFLTFNHRVIDSFDLGISLKFVLKNRHYIVSISSWLNHGKNGSEVLYKSYSELLTNDEIDLLVKSQLDWYNQLIIEKIKEAKN